MRRMLSSLQVSMIFLYLLSLAVLVHSRATRHSRCESNINVSGGSGVRIEPLEDSSVQINSLSREFYDGEKLEFEFKTSKPDGLLFYATRRNDESELMAVQLVDGHLLYSIRCNQGYATLIIPKKRADDDKWHKIRYSRRQMKGYLEINGVTYYENYLLTCGGFTSLVFGGVRANDWGLEAIKSLETVRGKNGQYQFSGCLRKLNITTGTDQPPYYVKVTSCNS